MRYRVNSPHVISETLGGETVIVNLASGHYFNLQGTAVDIWEAIERGETPAGIVSDLERRYIGGAGEIGPAVENLLEELAAAELIAAEEGDGGVAAPALEAPAIVERGPFVVPVLTAYTDMQDIILLDPVHEVDPRGWPHAAAGS